MDELDNLPLFRMSDQPEECRHCGARTEFVELPDGDQFHECLACGFAYKVCDCEYVETPLAPKAR